LCTLTPSRAEARRQEEAAQAAAIEAELAAAQAEEESLRAEDEAVQAQRARDEALAAHERTRAVLESTSDGHIALDPQWRIRYVNTKLPRLWSRMACR
jgi:PAS domain-containing protein